MRFARGEVRKTGECGVGAALPWVCRPRRRGARGEEVEGDAAHREAGAGEELAAREMVEEGVGGFMGG